MCASEPYSCSLSFVTSSGNAPGTRNHFLEPPALQFRKRPGGNNSYRIAHARFTGFVMRVVFLSEAKHALIERVARGARDLHDDGLLHFGAGDHADQFLPRTALAGGFLDCRYFVCHHAFLNSASRSRVLMRAKSRFASRSFFRPSACPVES